MSAPSGARATRIGSGIRPCGAARGPAPAASQPQPLRGHAIRGLDFPHDRSQHPCLPPRHARRIRAGSLSATALTEALLARIAAREPEVRAFVHLDAALALRAAAAADARAKAGRAGPLHGLGFGVKDVLDTADQPASTVRRSGPGTGRERCRLRRARPPGRRRDSRQDGHHRIRHPAPGCDRQPAQPEAYAGRFLLRLGGRGGGRFFHAGFGTQTAGSIIRPAAFCGAVGFKPSFGTLHRAGMKVMAEALDTIGVITGSVGDAALAMAGLTGGTTASRRRSRTAPRGSACCWGPTADQAAPETRALMERVAAAAARAGAKVTADRDARGGGGRRWPRMPW